MDVDVTQTLERIAAGDFSSLSAIVSRADLSKFEMDRVSHQLIALSRHRKVPIASGLQEALVRHKRPATPAFRRLAVHLFDAVWFEARDKRAAVQKLLADWRHEHVPAIDLFSGSLELNAGNRAAAFSLIEKAARESDEIGLPRMHLGAYSVRSGGEWLAQPRLSQFGPITWIRKSAESGPLCVMVAADAQYYINFAGALHASLRERDAESNIHFHVVNWRRECFPASGFADDRTSISAEVWPHARDFTYFATVRFFRAAEIMREFDRPLYITDIDNRFTGSPASILPDLDRYSAGFRYHSMGDWFPWWGPSGGNLWLRNDEQGRAVADWLHNYIANRFRPNATDSWWFDQLALNEVRHHAISNGVNVANLSDPALSVSVARPYAEVAALKSKYPAKS